MECGVKHRRRSKEHGVTKTYTGHRKNIEDTDDDNGHDGENDNNNDDAVAVAEQQCRFTLYFCIHICEYIDMCESEMQTDTVSVNGAPHSTHTYTHTCSVGGSHCAVVSFVSFISTLRTISENHRKE